MAKKEKKKKIKYIDDGSSLADMSGVGRGGKTQKDNNKRPGRGAKRERLARSSGKEIFRTYIESVKLMFLPMLVVLALLAFAFWMVYLMY